MIRPTRRSFLGYLGATAVAAGVKPLEAATRSGRMDVRYAGGPIANPWEALELFGAIQDTVTDPADLDKLRLVRRDGAGPKDRARSFSVIEDLDGTLKEATAHAKSHGPDLNDAGLARATPIRDQGFSEVFKITYPPESTLEDAKAQFARMYRALESSDRGTLVIEETPRGTHLVVYKSFDNTDATARIAARLANAVGTTGVLLQELNWPLAYGESHFLDETEIRPGIGLRVLPAPVDLRAPFEELEARARKRGVLTRGDRLTGLVYDLASNQPLFEKNADRPVQCASMFKPFVVEAAFIQGVPFRGPVRRHMTAMLQRSNNFSTNWLISHLGGPARVNDILQSTFPTIFQQTSIVEAIPPDLKAYRNVASPNDYCRFMMALYQGSMPGSSEILHLMALPKANRLVTGVPQIPHGTIVYDKTGTTARCVGDFGIMSPMTRAGERLPYFVAWIVERDTPAADYPRFGHACASVIRAVNGAVFSALDRANFYGHFDDASK